MPEQLILHLPEAEDGTFEYSVLDIHGQPTSHGRAGPEALRGPLTGRRCLALVPGTDVLLTRVHLPTRNSARIARALPYALEEQLASDIDELHFATGRPGRDGAIPAAVVALSTMDEWQEALGKLGIEPDAMIPENGALPLDPDHWQILADDRYALLSLGSGGYVLEPDLAPLTLEAALADSEQLPGRVTISAPDALCTSLQATLASLGERAAETEAAVEPTTVSLLQQLAPRLVPRLAVDLLQGPYTRRRRWGWAWQPLRPAAALLALWLVAQLGLVLTDIHTLERQADELRHATEQVYRETFPDSRVVNPAAQMRQQLNAVRGQSAPVQRPPTHLLAQAAPALAVEGLSVRSLRLRDGTLEVEVETTSIDQLEQTRTTIGGQDGIAVELRSATSRDGRVEGRLMIREAG